MGSFRQKDDVGATLVVAPLPGCDEWGDHKGRPYQRAMWEDAACAATPTLMTWSILQSLSDRLKRST